MDKRVEIMAGALGTEPVDDGRDPEDAYAAEFAGDCRAAERQLAALQAAGYYVGRLEEVYLDDPLNVPVFIKIGEDR